MAENERDEADAAIANGEAFKALYEHSAIGVALFSIGGRFLRANPAVCRLLGYGEEELLQKTHLDIVHLDDLEATAVARAQVISGKAKPRLTERRYVHKDGSAIWAHASGIAVRDAAGAPLCTVLFVVDVTGLKTALRASKRRFRRLIEMGSDWYWVQDVEFRFVEVPGIALEEIDGDTDIVVGKARWELPGLAALPEKAWEQHRAKLARHESFSDFVFLRYNKAGELRYLSVSGEPLFDAQGGFRGYHGVGKDITERARHQKALEESERRYRMLFDGNPHPMWVVDAKSLAFLAINEAAIRLYGYSKQEFLALSAEQIRPEEDIDDLRKAFEDPADYRSRIWRHRKKNGDVIPVKITSFNLDFDGRSARLGVIEDLTERMQAEERAQQSERRYRELLAAQGRGGG
jgi:PAS domain S-box-containing protein